jgi:hypothetical protein
MTVDNIEVVFQTKAVSILKDSFCSNKTNVNPVLGNKSPASWHGVALEKRGICSNWALWVSTYSSTKRKIKQLVPVARVSSPTCIVCRLPGKKKAHQVPSESPDVNTESSVQASHCPSCQQLPQVETALFF